MNQIKDKKKEKDKKKKTKVIEVSKSYDAKKLCQIRTYTKKLVLFK